MLKHKFQTAEPNDPAFDVSRTVWNDDHKLDGGQDGQVLVRDSTQDATTGARYVFMTPAEAYSSPAQVPVNQGGWVAFGVSPNRKVGIWFNDNGTVKEVISRTD